MNRPALGPPAAVLTIATAVAGLAALTGAAFAGWVSHGTEIFLAMAESGMSWCF